jgi:hypothetical protein
MRWTPEVVKAVKDLNIQFLFNHTKTKCPDHPEKTIQKIFCNVTDASTGTLLASVEGQTPDDAVAKAIVMVKDIARSVSTVDLIGQNVHQKSEIEKLKAKLAAAQKPSTVRSGTSKAISA